jgi:Cytochrome P460
MRPRRQITAWALAASVVSALSTLAAFGQDGDRGRLDVARYEADGKLSFPAGTDRWIAAGSDIGGTYADRPFDPARPGAIGVVQMEPTAYDYFLKNGRYADGTMFLLTFYAVQQNPQPALQGFVQGAVTGREIHVIDQRRFTKEGSGFFVFSQGTEQPVAPMSLGSVCVQCHAREGAFEGTFVQFYPPLRGHTAGSEK